MDGFRIPIGEVADVIVDWIRDNLKILLDIISNIVGFLVEGLADVLNFLPAPLMIVLFALIAWLFRSWQLAVGTAVTFTIIVGMDQWDHAMETLALVLIAALVTVAISVPLGIWAARNDRVSAFVKPVLDFMQTMPSMVYLIPVIVFFGVGFVPGVEPDRFLRRWKAARRSAYLELVPVPLSAQQAALAKGEVDMCFVRLPLEAEDLHLVPLWEERSAVVVGHENVLSLLEEISAADL
ncbi:MAG: LysR substrate-binding domain-containing protein, partial [Microbacterium sp.]